MIRRILVALDSSPNSLAALDAAAELAALLKAELLGLFVEDINLLRLAELPFAHEVGFPSAVRHKLSAAAMERSLKVAAQEARRAMAAVALRAAVRWSFRVARGSVASELLAAAEDEGDLIAFGTAGRKLGRQSVLGSTALGVFRRAPCKILLLPRAAGHSPPVACVAAGGSGAALGGVAAAAFLARAWGGGLVVLIRGGKAASARMGKAVARLPAAAEIDMRFRGLAGAGAAAILRAAWEERAGALVISGAPRAFAEHVLAELVDKTGCRVLLARRVPKRQSPAAPTQAAALSPC